MLVGSTIRLSRGRKPKRILIKPVQNLRKSLFIVKNNVANTFKTHVQNNIITCSAQGMCKRVQSCRFTILTWAVAGVKRPLSMHVFFAFFLVKTLISQVNFTFKEWEDPNRHAQKAYKKDFFRRQLLFLIKIESFLSKTTTAA